MTRVFSEGGPTLGAALIAAGLADEVILLTAEKPLGRPGRPALEADALAALGDPARYREGEGATYGADVLRRWERRGGQANSATAPRSIPLRRSRSPIRRLGAQTAWEYSAFRRGQSNFIASTPAMRPIGSPAIRRSSTSRQMCQPAAPIAMKRRSRCATASDGCRRRSGPPIPSACRRRPSRIGANLGWLGPTLCCVSDGLLLRARRAWRDSPGRPSTPKFASAFERRPLAGAAPGSTSACQTLGGAWRKESDKNERPLISVLMHFGAAGGTRRVRIAIGHGFCSSRFLDRRWRVKGGRGGVRAHRYAPTTGVRNGCEPRVDLLQRLGLQPVEHGAARQSLASTKPASRSTRRCLDTVGCGRRSFRSISPTDCSRSARRPKIARRFGSAIMSNTVSMPGI